MKHLGRHFDERRAVHLTPAQHDMLFGSPVLTRDTEESLSRIASWFVSAAMAIGLGMLFYWGAP